MHLWPLPSTGIAFGGGKWGWCAEQWPFEFPRIINEGLSGWRISIENPLVMLTVFPDIIIIVIIIIIPAFPCLFK